MAEIPPARSITVRPEPAAGTGGAARCDHYSSLFSPWGSRRHVIWGIEKEAAQLDFQSLISALRATPTANCAAAVATTVLSYLALVGYDICGLRYARAHAPLPTILLASFSGFAIGNAVGLGAFSGGACATGSIRPRYPAGQIARTILFISIAFGIGLATISALGLLLHAGEVSRLSAMSPEPLRVIAAIILALVGGVLIFGATRQPHCDAARSTSMCRAHHWSWS